MLTLQELKRDDEARKRLDAARAKYPESAELVVLDATMLAKAKRPEDADRLLAEFLAKVPDNVPVVQMRAQILAQDLDRPAEARKLLADVAERGDNSAPLVQLALLELAAKDYDAVAASIAKVRARWKDAATGDLLDAQLALARNDLRGGLRLLRRRPQEGPEQQGRPVLEGPARRPGRPRGGLEGLRVARPGGLDQGARGRRSR